MRLARFELEGKIRFGIVREDEIEELKGTLFEKLTVNGPRHRLEKVRLLAPVTPLQSWAPGLNFRSHLAIAQKVTGQASMHEAPTPWQKGVGGAIIGPDEAILIPSDSSSGIEYEGECVAVIGKVARRVSPADAWSYILGYTCGNDVSERTWQKEDRTYWRAKGSDTFSPLGPWIETEVEPRRGCELIVRLNGREAQRANTQEMHFDFGTLVSYISQSVTMHPGDLVWSGSSGVPGKMAPGDVVEVEVEGVGILRNRVRNERG